MLRLHRMDNAFKFDEKSGGLCSEADYPYKAVQGPKCKTDCVDVPGSAVKTFVDVPPGDEKALLSAIAMQPISIAIQADQVSFGFHVLSNFACRLRRRLFHSSCSSFTRRESSMMIAVELKLWSTTACWLLDTEPIWRPKSHTGSSRIAGVTPGDLKDMSRCRVTPRTSTECALFSGWLPSLWLTLRRSLANPSILSRDSKTAFPTLVNSLHNLCIALTF